MLHNYSIMLLSSLRQHKSHLAVTLKLPVLLTAAASCSGSCRVVVLLLPAADMHVWGPTQADLSPQASKGIQPVNII